MKDRIGQQVKICHEPLMIAEVDGWDATRGLWQATYIVPAKMGTKTVFREEFLQLLDDEASASTTEAEALAVTRGEANVPMPDASAADEGGGEP